jgi:hypothetical protein
MVVDRMVWKDGEHHVRVVADEEVILQDRHDAQPVCLSCDERYDAGSMVESVPSNVVQKMVMKCGLVSVVQHYEPV